MAESTLSLAYNDIRTEVADTLRYGRTESKWTADQKSRMDASIEAGLRGFYSAHNWTFLRPITTLSTVADYSTGTVGVASGVVTLTGGTWPSWVETDTSDADLTVSGTTYAISTYDSTTQVTLVDTSVTVTAGASYNVSRPTYTMPDDFSGFDGKMTYRPGDSSFYPPIRFINENQIRTYRQQYETTTRPRYACLRPKSFNPKIGQRWQLQFWPSPDAVYVLTYRYRSNPQKLDSTNQYPLGGAIHSETILSACLAAAERKYMDNSLGRHHMGEYEKLLSRSITLDGQQIGADTLGIDTDPSDMPSDDGALPTRPWGGYVQYTGHTLRI